MGKLFFTIYLSFSQRKILPWIIIITILSVGGWRIVNTKFEEDILKVLPFKDDFIKYSEVLENSGIQDKLFITFETGSGRVDSTKSVLDAFVQQMGSVDSTFIDEVLYQFDDDLTTEVPNLVYEHMPIYMQDADYTYLDSLISDTSLLKQTLSANLTMLTSPAGMVMKRYVIEDPTGIGFKMLERLKELNVEKDFELKNGRVYHKSKNIGFMYLLPSEEAKTGGNTDLFLAQLEECVQNIESGSDVKITVFGALMVANANANRTKVDIYVTVSVTVFVLFFGLSLFFKDLLIVFKLFLPVILGALLSLICLSFRSEPISIIAIAIGSAILGMSIDFSLHIVNHWKGKRGAQKVFRDVATPILMSSLTTALAFLGLLFIKSPALSDLGIFAALSVTFSSLASLIFLPHLLKENTQPRTIGKLKYLTKPLRILTVLAIVFGAMNFTEVEFEKDLMQLNYMPDSLAQSQDYVQGLSNSSLRSSYLFSEGETLDQALEELEKDSFNLRNLKDKKYINYYTDVSLILKSEKAQKEAIQRWKAYWSSGKKEQLDSVLSVFGPRYRFRKGAFRKYFGKFENEPELLDSNDYAFISEKIFSENIIEKGDGYYVMSIVKYEEKNIAQPDSVFSSTHNTFLNKQVMATKLLDTLSHDFEDVVNYSFVVVFIVLLLAYGRIELTLITYIPIICGWVVTLGLMSLLGLKFNVVNIILTSLIFGLGIDYSIFYVRGFLNRYHYGEDEVATYRNSILLSAGTTLVGVGVLVLAKHPATHSVGVLSVIGILSVVTITLVLIPLMFNTLITKNTENGQIPNTALSFFGTILIGVFLLIGIVELSILAIPLQFKKVKNTRYDDFYHYALHLAAKFLAIIGAFYVRRDFDLKPDYRKHGAMIIANHQSSLDIMMMIASHPKLILATNDNVWKNKFYGFLVRSADYFNVTDGIESYQERVKAKIDRGYSVLIFPEGTRNEKPSTIKRFYKGAFMMAEAYNMDIFPVLLVGLNDVIPKGSLTIHPGKTRVVGLDIIKAEDEAWGTTYKERAKSIVAFMRAEYATILSEFRDEGYRARIINSNFIYKGPVLEWYQKIKVRLEKSYRFFNGVVPKGGTVVDIGCGYGFLAMSLGIASDKRNVIGVDYDEEKIETAKHLVSKPGNVNFVCGDALKLDIERADTYLMLDILHYLPRSLQEDLVQSCMQKLSTGGLLIIRDANTENEKKQKGTWLTEFLSTNLGFNKTEHKLDFVGKSDLVEMLSNFNYRMKTVKSSKVLSNLVYIIEKTDD